MKYDGVLSPNWLVEASVARAQNELVETPSVNSWSVTDGTVMPNVISGGIGFYEEGNDGKNLPVPAASRRTSSRRHHQMRYGVLYEDIHYDNSTSARARPSRCQRRRRPHRRERRVLADPGVGRIYRVTRANLNTARADDAAVHELLRAGHLALGDRLTMRPGIRYEQQKLVGHTRRDFTWSGNWAPRIGATYDVTGQRQVEALRQLGPLLREDPNDLAARALSADAGVTRADYFDAALTQPVPDGVPLGRCSTPSPPARRAASGALRSRRRSRPTTTSSWRVRVRAVRAT